MRFLSNSFDFLKKEFFWIKSSSENINYEIGTKIFKYV